MSFLEITVTGAVMVLAVAAVRALTLCRLPKGAFVALWWASALRLLTPVTLPFRFSVYTLLEALRPQTAISAAPAAPAGTAAIPSPIQVIPIPPAAAPEPASEPFPIWMALWAAGAVLLGLWFLIRYVRWRRRFRESLPVDHPGLETWTASRRTVTVRASDRVAAPLTYGLVRPVILLPKSLDLTDEEMLSCVLAHELVHIRRLDGLLKLVLAAALCVHWFNPAVWLLYVLANRDMELRCDEAAVLSLGEDSRKRYALALLRLAEKQCVPLCGFSQKSGMEERIRAIMSIKKKSFAACAAALALVLVVTTAFATSAKPEDVFDEDMSDAGIQAQVSAEVAAQWDEVLTPYAPFGLGWTFDDPDLDGNGLAMTWEGYEVRGIYDEEKGTWITEHAGDGAYGPDSVELYAVYEGGELKGLRLATEEEQAEFSWYRGSASGALKEEVLKVEALVNSIRYDSGNIYFTIPEGEGIWSIFIQGRVMTEDGMGMSVHYLEEESERAEWVPRMTYSFEVADAAYDELSMDVKYGNAAYFYDLTLLLPEGGRPVAQPALSEGKAGVPEGMTMIWPVDSGEVTNAFGNRAKPGGEGVVTHTGVDIGGMEQGTPIYAAAAGTVKSAGFDASHGNYVRLDHGEGLETFYAHCRSVEVEAGENVALGQTIATVGSTGNSTGPHLHFEVLLNGEAQNPELFYRQKAAGPVGQEGNTDLPAGVPEKKLTDGAAAIEPGPAPEPAPQREGLEGAKTDPSETAPLEPNGQEPVGMAIQREELVNGDYPTNSRGETYGNAFGYDLTGHEPDLMAAVGTNGESGYISMEETQLSWSPDPEEIGAYQNWKEENKVTGYTIPLYDKDHNIIGEFQVGDGGPGSKTFEEMKAAKAQGWPNKNGSTPVEREPIFKSLEEAQAAVENGWVGDNYSGYYAN